MPPRATMEQRGSENPVVDTAPGLALVSRQSSQTLHDPLIITSCSRTVMVDACRWLCTEYWRFKKGEPRLAEAGASFSVQQSRSVSQ